MKKDKIEVRLVKNSENTVSGLYAICVFLCGKYLKTIAVFDPKQKIVCDLTRNGLDQYYVPNLSKLKSRRDGIDYVTVSTLGNALKFEKQFEVYAKQYFDSIKVTDKINDQIEENNLEINRLRNRITTLDAESRALKVKTDDISAARCHIVNPTGKPNTQETECNNSMWISVRNPGMKIVHIGCKELPLGEFKKLLAKMKKLSSHKK